MSSSAVASFTETSVPGGRLIAIMGRLDRDGVPEVERSLLRLSDKGPLTLDLSGITRLDTAGAALLGVMERRCRAGGHLFEIDAASDVARAALKILRIIDAEPEDASPKRPLPERIGAAAEDWAASAVSFLSITADAFAWSLGGARRTRRVRRGAAWTEASVIGASALPIVGLIALLIGVVVALQSAYQLRQFGGTLYVANLLAVSMTREMGPLMTAIIVAGRSGASIAAEIATMQVSDEIAALKTMGLSPVRYVVVPKLQAMTICLPALVVYANVIGIVGGFAVAFLYLDLSATVYFTQAWGALVPLDIFTGMLKSLVFGWLIVLIAAHNGFAAHGGAESVGAATTRSVVSGIFWVIVSDAVFSVVFYFGD
ncbi:MAG: phospholipid/cholesterol/gamma-HCH transport system permease protein [Myxococcota bacterium]|jgi:phospholipid/cholesterol/gamma-HCH transport system permease protein